MLQISATFGTEINSKTNNKSKYLSSEINIHKTRFFMQKKKKNRCDYLLALRVLILRRRHPKRWRTLSKLQSHEKDRGPGTEAYEETRAVAEYLGPLLAHDAGSAEILSKVCGIIDVNALETNPPEGSAALYETACLLEHSCVANTRHTFTIDEQGRPKISVIAVTNIKK